MNSEIWTSEKERIRVNLNEKYRENIVREPYLKILIVIIKKLSSNKLNHKIILSQKKILILKCIYIMIPLFVKTNIVKLLKEKKKGKEKNY